VVGAVVGRVGVACARRGPRRSAVIRIHRLNRMRWMPVRVARDVSQCWPGHAERDRGGCHGREEEPFHAFDSPLLRSLGSAKKFSRSILHAVKHPGQGVNSAAGPAVQPGVTPPAPGGHARRIAPQAHRPRRSRRHTRCTSTSTAPMPGMWPRSSPVSTGKVSSASIKHSARDCCEGERGNPGLSRLRPCQAAACTAPADVPVVA